MSLFWILVFGLLLFLILTRKKLISLFFGVADYIFYYRFLSMLPVPMYNEGFGERERYEKLESYKFRSKPHEIDVEFSEQKNIKNKERAYFQTGHFRSPFYDILRKGEGICEFSYMHSPNCEKDGKKKLAIILPAAGQQRYGFRKRNFGDKLLDRGVSVLLPIAPAYFSRSSRGQRGIGMRTVVDTPITFFAIIEEIRSLILYFAKEKNYNVICVCGMSMGADRTLHFCNMPLCIPEMSIELGVCVFMGYTEIKWKGILANSKVISPKILSRNKEQQQEEVMECPIDTKNKTGYGRLNEVLGKYITPDFYLKNDGEEENEKKKKFHHHPKVAVQMSAEWDMIVPHREAVGVEKFLKEVLGKYDKGETYFVHKVVGGGHFSSFFRKEALGGFLKGILQVFSKLEEIGTQNEVSM